MFNFDAPASLTPTLTITSLAQTQRNLSWNPVTLQIMKDDEWNYCLSPMRDDTLAVERTNQNGKREYYSNEKNAGIITIGTTNGVTRIIKLFVDSGALNGDVRSVTTLINDKVETVRKFDYDEKGRTIRERVEGLKIQEFTFKYDHSGNQTEVDKDGGPFVKCEFDAQGRLKAKIFATGIKQSYLYVDNQVHETTHLLDGTTIENKWIDSEYVYKRADLK